MNRIYHPWHAWECYYEGLFDSSPPDGMSPDQAKLAYRDFLSDLDRFQLGMENLDWDWPVSCEQFLSNNRINRIAWLGQAAMCIETGVPRAFRGGFKLLSVDQQRAANSAAGTFLEDWIQRRKGSLVSGNHYDLKYHKSVRKRVENYVRVWRKRGYLAGIPDKAPEQLTRLGLAPSYKQVAVAILSSDVSLRSLGFTAPTSPVYSAIKRMEIEENDN